MKERKEILNIIEEIIKDVLDNSELTFQEEIYLEDIPEWDSVVQMTIMAVIEQQFKVRFDIDRIANAKTISSIIDMVIEKQS